MEDIKIPYLCGCVLYLLLRKVTLPDASARQHNEGVKDEHKNPIFMADLVYTFTGVQTVGSASDTSNYREGKKEGSINVPFNDPAYISSFDDAVKHRYTEVLDRVCQFVNWHLNLETRGWFVKACLDVIENDNDIADTDVFYIRNDGTSVSKAELKTECVFELQPFLLGVLHYVLVHRANKNHLGIPTLDANTTKVARKERQYSGQLGNSITRTITVGMYEKKRKADVQDSFNLPTEPESILVSDELDEQTDNEVINGAMMQTSQVLASVLGAVQTPKINADAMAGGLATVAVVAKRCAPDDKQKETMVQGVSTIAAALKANKHAIAEEIRRNSRREKTTSSSETPDSDGEPVEESAQGDKKTTIIQQQTNVIQNGDNNVNMTNNGTITFNF